ncbi:MAG: hypothetical protein IT460_15165 [Planctomycetes bacterium]|nr:hypothetical protein [Planctomycetota bacterium]
MRRAASPRRRAGALDVGAALAVLAVLVTLVAAAASCGCACPPAAPACPPGTRHVGTDIYTGHPACQACGAGKCE